MESPQRLMAEIAAEQYGVIQRAQALRAGLTKAQIEHQFRAGAWTRVLEGVYRSTALPETWESQLVAACLTGGQLVAASHRSAAELFDLPGRSRSIVEVTGRRWGRSHRDGLVVHESLALEEPDITSVRGIPSTTVERTLLDLGAVRGYLTVQMAFDRAIKEGKTSWTKTNETLERLARSGRPGVTKLRAALQARAHTRIPESEQETALLALLASNGLPEPQPQFSIVDSSGAFLARVDAAYPEHRIVIEYDSDLHHSDVVALARDNARRNRLVGAGWKVIAARHADIRSGGHEFCQIVAASLQDGSCA